MFEFWRKKIEVPTVEVALKTQTLAKAPVEESIPEPETPYGAKVGKLIQFGKTWLDLSQLSVLEFDPPDGCGAECRFKDSGKSWHIPYKDAQVLHKYLEEFATVEKAVDAATELLLDNLHQGPNE
jgi:hypothetical protein